MSSDTQNAELVEKLKQIEQRYLAVIPAAPDLRFLEDKQIVDYISTESGQSWLVEKLLQRLQPDAVNSWRLRYWKQVIAALEKRLSGSGDEIDSRLYDGLCLFLTPAVSTCVSFMACGRVLKPHESNYRRIFQYGADSQEVLLDEERAAISQGMWPASPM